MFGRCCSYSASIHYHFTQEPKFVIGEEKTRKLFDLQNFAAYFDTEVLGELEGQELVVSFPYHLVPFPYHDWLPVSLLFPMLLQSHSHTISNNRYRNQTYSSFSAGSCVNQKKFTNLKLVLISCYHGESEETVEQLAIENQKCSDFKLTTENHIHAGAS